MIKEEWRDVVGYEGLYQVSSLGRVRAKDRISSSGHKLKGKIRKLNPTKHGYLLVNLCKGGIVKHLSVHRLVAQAFIPNPENKPQVNHIDGNKSNNHTTNLEWVTRSENMFHAIEIGLLDVKGTSNFKAKVTEEQVREMRKLREINPKKYTYKKLGDKYGISSVMAGDIVKKIHWKHII